MQWLTFVLYGFTAALFSYCFSLFTALPLASFAAVAGYLRYLRSSMIFASVAFNPTFAPPLDLLGSVSIDGHVRKEITK